ncbi:unnamed protein product [Notodromas monacha]|uniref:Mitochondrial import receptor subunit TOM20 homolog n=1 Tax=Notodromas monacha TaxID=399045 RepID=A0A7R9GGG0_9CRUS|nr:unnamed protein product [Notodromas monacha]CAG0921663.1 unnamed protein product [Notodromas monacha]
MSVVEFLQSKSTLLAAGVCGTLFLSYCVYFDRKRRSDPAFKQRLREKRKKERMQNGSRGPRMPIPQFTNQDEVHRYFLEQLQAGEEALNDDDVEMSAEYFVNALLVSGSPREMLRSFSETLPPALVEKIISILPMASQRLNPLMMPGFGSAIPVARVAEEPPPREQSVSIVEDDVD